MLDILILFYYVLSTLSYIYCGIVFYRIHTHIHCGLSHLNISSMFYLNYHLSFFYILVFIFQTFFCTFFQIFVYLYILKLFDSNLILWGLGNISFQLHPFFLFIFWYLFIIFVSFYNLLNYSLLTFIQIFPILLSINSLFIFSPYIHNCFLL